MNNLSTKIFVKGAYLGEKTFLQDTKYIVI